MKKLEIIKELLVRNGGIADGCFPVGFHRSGRRAKVWGATAVIVQWVI
jgi:hypothetical protein